MPLAARRLTTALRGTTVKAILVVERLVPLARCTWVAPIFWNEAMSSSLVGSLPLQRFSCSARRSKLSDSVPATKSSARRRYPRALERRSARCLRSSSLARAWSVVNMASTHRLGFEASIL